MNPGRTFALDVGSDGAASLQKVILKKLTEFMGDYTDDVLAQYILVLVAHGKQQAQATKDLEAFLGDQSESFVAWLWNYLSSNSHLHASVSKASVLGSNGMGQKVEQTDNGTVKGAQADLQVSSSKHKHGEKMKSGSSSARVLPDLNGPPPKIANSDYGGESDKLEAKERDQGWHPRHTAKRQHSPLDTAKQKERKKASDVKHHRKRRISPLGVNATRRLLQSAVREAVAPVAGLTKSSSKRLRSVVSTDIDNSVTIEDANKPRENNDVDDVRQGRAGAATAPADTKILPQNAVTGRGSVVGSVWDRLGRTATNLKKKRYEGEQEMVDSSFLFANSCLDDEGGNNKVLLGHQSRLTAPNFSWANGYAAEEMMSEGLANACRGGQHQTNVTNEARLLNHAYSHHVRVNDNQEVPQYGLVKNVHTGLKETQKMPSILGSSRQFDVSGKHVVCSQGQEPRTSQTELPQSQTARMEGDNHKDVLEMKKRLDDVQKEMMKLRARQSESNKELQVVSSSSLPGTEQAQKTQDSLHKRTVFVTNIHFAATKESITTHFSQCGKVEQVIVIMDGTTGKPKGSAYVEFSMAAEAEKALALNETSFYSRMLKVVPTDALTIKEMHSNQLTSIRHPNPVPSIPFTRGRVFRGSFNPVPGFASTRATYMTPTKLQWKRDSTATSAANGNKPGLGLPVRSIAKSFTYVRNSSAPAVKEGTGEGEKGAT